MTPEYRNGEPKDGPTGPLSIYANICSFQGLSQTQGTKNAGARLKCNVTTEPGTRLFSHRDQRGFKWPVPVPCRRRPTARGVRTTYRQRH